MVPDCVGGNAKDDFAPTFRPEHHKPPASKAWSEGFAEAVSINPQRPIHTEGGTADCRYHYADSALVKGTPRGDMFMLATCSSPTTDPRDNRFHVGPVVFREDGYARFSVAYRAA
jgi:hypothetical protein